MSTATHRGKFTMAQFKDVKTKFIEASGIRFAYRELGQKTGVPVIFLVHLAAVLDN